MFHIKTLALIAVAVFMVSNLRAQDDAGIHGCALKVCKPVVEITKDKKTCYKIECKEVCIPKVRLPWQKCCEPQCGVVKKVKILKKDSREIEKCGYKWEITDGDPCDAREPGCRLKFPRPFRCIKGSCNTICDCAPNTNHIRAIRDTKDAIITAAKPLQTKSNADVAIVSDKNNNSYYRIQPKR